MAGTTDLYRLQFNSGIDGLKLNKNVQIPELGAHQCLVKIEAVSLNYRDIAMTSDAYPNPTRATPAIPCSDAAGTVIQVGSGVTQFKMGDRVCNTFFQAYESGFITQEARMTSLGATNDGVLSQKLIVPETGLVAAPASLTAVENSTLPCAALTAWNSLFGLEGRTLKAGEWVLTQGTGGVSIFAIQFALAIGANVIATTSSESKAQKLRAIGVKHIINYREDLNWGETAKKLTPGGLGVHQILEVGGEKTLTQSFKAVRLEGLISIIGFLGGKDSQSNLSFWDTFKTVTVVRGVNVGSRKQFREMNAFIEQKKIKPVVDEKVFAFEDAKEAYKALETQKFFGKVVIKVD